MSGWTCQRQSRGVVCKHRNTPRAKKCAACGKLRPPRRRPSHMAALEVPYEEYIRINGGERCGICGSPPREDRRLDRDHDHKGDGRPRGLLCRPCNRRLTQRVTNNDWILKAVAYLARSATQ